MSNNIGIINYNSGNIIKLKHTLEKLGVKTMIISNIKDMNLCDKIVLPGVGSYSVSSRYLKAKKLDIEIKKFVKKNRPVLSICLGFQLMLTNSEEDLKCKGLNLLKGKVKNLNTKLKKTKIPNIGWKKVDFTKNSNKFLRKFSGEKFYFAHSYFCDFATMLPSSYITIERQKILSSLNKENLFCYQFHPEMSGEIGVEVLRNFKDL
jgi:imidazole glycerol-phosphate synthase subunit HisH